MNIWFITFILFLLTAAAGMAIYSLTQSKEKRDRYMSVISGDKAAWGAEDAREKKLSKQRAEIAKKLKEAGVEGNSGKVSMKMLMSQAGIDAPASRFWMISAFLGFVVWLLVSITDMSQIVKAMIIFTAFLGVPKFFLKIMVSRRQKKFMDEFADALDGMGRLLQSGIPMSEAIAMGAREFKGPIREELTVVYENQKIGIPLGEAALLMSKRVPLPEVHMFATALHIQSETGSSLSEVLENLSGVIRARYRLKRKIKAVSSEAKSSAAIIAALPILVVLGLYAVRPEYIGVLFEDPKGKVIISGAGLWMSFGILIMRQMINFKI